MAADATMDPGSFASTAVVSLSISEVSTQAFGSPAISDDRAVRRKYFGDALDCRCVEKIGADVILVTGVKGPAFLAGK
jgi:hypothetical protein